MESINVYLLPGHCGKEELFGSHRGFQPLPQLPGHRVVQEEGGKLAGDEDVLDAFEEGQIERGRRLHEDGLQRYMCEGVLLRTKPKFSVGSCHLKADRISTSHFFLPSELPVEYDPGQKNCGRSVALHQLGPLNILDFFRGEGEGGEGPVGQLASGKVHVVAPARVGFQEPFQAHLGKI